MAQPKEVHCPFCHHKEMFDGPVGSTVRCRNCKSIFRMPVEGVKRGEKVKKYTTRRHSPAYYVILLLLIGAGVFAYFQIQKVLQASQQRLADIWVKLDDPFAANVTYTGDRAAGVVERFMECWKLGKDKSEKTGDYTGFECMLLYVMEDELDEFDGLDDAVKAFTERFGRSGSADLALVSYRLSKVFREGVAGNPQILKNDVTIRAKSGAGMLEKHGDMTVTVVYGDNRRLSEARHKLAHPDEDPQNPEPVEALKTWGVCVMKANPIWE